MTTLELFPLLQTNSKRAILREKKNWGRPYIYTPRGDLLENLAKKTGRTMEEVYNQLMKERAFLLKHSQYFK